MAEACYPVPSGDVVAANAHKATPHVYSGILQEDSFLKILLWLALRLLQVCFKRKKCKKDIVDDLLTHDLHDKSIASK
jgi:hypothetical protein